MGRSSIVWPLPGLADDVALAAAGGRLWAAASTATLEREEVYLGEVTEAGLVRTASVSDDGPCCRPALAAFDGGGALAVACSPRGRLVAAFDDGAAHISRWQLVLGGAPIHAAAVALRDTAWLAIEIATGRERAILVLAVEPATGHVRERHTLGSPAAWLRWPALGVHRGALVVAWCEGSPRTRGTVRIARWGARDAALEVSRGPGEAPAFGVTAGGRIAIAWHRGGPGDAGELRDGSVVRAIEAALVELDSGAIVPASPPAGAGGADPRGEDQGWELPAIATADDGSLWLVGRSTHGHHVARRAADGRWTAPSALDAGGWGARGRRHALAVHEGAVWLARRSPEGLVIGPCPAPRDALATIAPPARSRPARLPPRAVAGILFGDLHQHTAHSDGCGSLEDLWIAARGSRGLDFAAITDHDRFCQRALGPATWQLASQIAAAFDEPGRFVALAGYEFTGPRYPGPGHKCVYFGDRVPDRVPDKDVATLFAVLREHGGIAVPHHVGWTGGDFSHHDPEVQPVWELCSVHGCYASDDGCGAHPPRADHAIPGQFVRDALAAGLRFGFIGSTDSHGLDWHHGIARWRNPFHAGLACLVGAEPTRGGVLAALRARTTYATSGARIGLAIDLDGAPIGSELPAGTRGDVAIEVEGTAAITTIALVHARGEQRLVVDGSGLRARARGQVPSLRCPDYVYVRVEQADGETAWASPFFIG